MVRIPSAVVRSVAAFVLTVAVLLPAADSVRAQPTIVEPGWSLIRTISATKPISARYNPVDNQIYFGQRGSGADGLYRIDTNGFREKVSSGSNVAGVAVHPDSGHAYFSEDYGGVVYRTELGSLGRATWVSGWRSGDDDPIGIAFVPDDYSGTAVTPGAALSADRGYNGFDDVWTWDPFVAEGESQVHIDDGTLIGAVDIAVSSTTVYIADSGETNPGTIYILEPAGILTPMTLSETIDSPAGLAIDPMTGDLLVVDQTGGKLVRVVPGTGQVTDIVTGLTAAGINWGGVDITADGRQLILTGHSDDAIYILARCDATGDPEADCNDNGIYDLCEIADGSVDDCNGNGVPDACDLAAGTSQDCNLDGVLDDCPVCPTVEVAFIMDTSSSMDDEAAALCANMDLIVEYLESSGVTVVPTLYGICNLPGGAYSCLTTNITASLGTAVPGSPPAGLETLGACPGGNEVCHEDWGLATAVVAGLHPWMPDSTSIRLVVPLSDEGAWCGDPVTQMDEDAVTHAIGVALANEVIVSPITASGSSGAVVAQAQRLADDTGGSRFASSESGLEIAYGIADLILAACASVGDCDLNGIPDTCEIAGHPSLDLNNDGILDVCQSGVSAVGPGDVPAPTAVLHQNHPNPFNPSTVMAFHLGRAGNTELTVYSLDGRLVRTLLSKAMPQGHHEVTWDGRDDAGSAMPAGVYLYRLETDSFSMGRRMVLIK